MTAMKRILFYILLLLIALSALAACQSDGPDVTLPATVSQPAATLPITTTIPTTPAVSVTKPSTPHTTVPPVTTTAPKPETTVTTPAVTTTVTTSEVTTAPVPVTTTGTGPSIGNNDNYPDWGPVISMAPVPTPETLPETAPVVYPDTPITGE